MATTAQFVDDIGVDTVLHDETGRYRLAWIEGTRERGRVPRGSVDRLLEVHPQCEVSEQEQQLPLVLLVTAWSSAGEDGYVITQHECRRERRPRPAPGLQRGRQSRLQPGHLQPGAEAEPELRHRRRALQPASARGGGDDVSQPIDHVDMAGVSAGDAIGGDRGLTYRHLKRDRVALLPAVFANECGKTGRTASWSPGPELPACC